MGERESNALWSKIVYFFECNLFKKIVDLWPLFAKKTIFQLLIFIFFFAMPFRWYAVPKYFASSFNKSCMFLRLNEWKYSFKLSLVQALLPFHLAVYIFYDSSYLFQSFLLQLYCPFIYPSCALCAVNRWRTMTTCIGMSVWMSFFFNRVILERNKPFHRFLCKIVSFQLDGPFGGGREQCCA